MPFPISRQIEGILHAPAPEATRQLQQALVQMGATRIAQEQDGFSFRVPYGITGSALRFIDAGHVLVEQLAAGRCRVAIDLSFRRTAAVLALALFLWLGVGARLLFGLPWWKVGDDLPFLGFGFVWLLGPWYLITPHKLSRSLKLRSSKAP